MSTNQEEVLYDLHLRYIKQIVIPHIVGDFKNEKFEDVDIENSTGLDGFMSAIYNVSLKTLPNESATVKERLLIVKFMKGDEAFRVSTKSDIQFANEIFMYAKVIPAFNELLTQANLIDISVNNFAAHCYLAKFGFIEGLSATPTTKECVLVLENLKPKGYTMGPRLYLRRDHLLSIAKTLGQYHAMSYALRYNDALKFETLREGIIPFLKSEDPDNGKPNVYTVMYRIACDRFFEYFDRVSEREAEIPDGGKYIKNVLRLREKYFKEPTKLLEWTRTSVEHQEKDKDFNVFLHGDLNRNNVLFRYEEGEGDIEERQVEDAKFIDFQELRYGTPALDLIFFMYFNTPELLRDDIWLEILKCYHSHMFNALQGVLSRLKSDNENKKKAEKYLEKYSFHNFIDHFSRYAFYGVMIRLHFLTWCLSTEAECSQLSHYFLTDMQGKEFYKISMTAGGDEVNEKILNIVKHASKMGYMDHF